MNTALFALSGIQELSKAWEIMSGRVRIWTQIPLSWFLSPKPQFSALNFTAVPLPAQGTPFQIGAQSLMGKKNIV